MIQASLADEPKEGQVEPLRQEKASSMYCRLILVNSARPYSNSDDLDDRIEGRLGRVYDGWYSLVRFIQRRLMKIPVDRILS